MNCVKDEADTQILIDKQSDSSSHDEGSSDQSSPTGRSRVALKKGPWTSAEDDILINYVEKHGEGNWNAVQKYSGLSRCGKSCRLRWVNHLRPNLKKGGFSPQEEQAVIQLHRRMGNKWARMAALIPGRTDNEIKNFWNTFVKRRHRAGLPLYPTVVCHQTSTENQQFENGTVLQGAKPDIPEFHFDPSRADPGLLCYAPSSGIPVNGMLSSGLESHPGSVTGMLSQGLGSDTSSFLNPGVNCIKQNWESETSFGGYHDKLSVVVPTSEQLLRNHPETAYWNHDELGYPHEPDPCNKNPVPAGCSIPGSHALLNGNFSASSHPLGTVKLELPSLQYPGSDYGNWCTSPYGAPYEAIDTYIQSPGNVPVLPGCVSPRSNGLLEALVQESQALSFGKNQSYKRACSPAFSPSDMIESSIIEWEDTSEPCSPVCQSAVSLLNECNIPISRASFDGFPPCKAPSGMQSSVEQVFNPCVLGDWQRPDFLRPDAMLESDFFYGCFQNSMEDAIAAAFGDQDLLQLPASLDSYEWNSMPCVHQISEHS